MTGHSTALAPGTGSLTFSDARTSAAIIPLDGVPMLRIAVLGGVTLAFNGRDIILRNRKARAMLAYLALSEAGEEQRERLAGLFWSEFSEENARATLRQALHELRGVMLEAGCDALIGTRMAVRLRRDRFQVDVNELMTAVATRETPDGLLRQARLAESLLAGFEDLDPAFHSWLMARRQTLHDFLMRGLESGFHDMTLPSRQRRRLAEAALLLDPTHEEACRVVMRVAAENGELGAALRAYDELYRLLGDDYDMEPSAATQALVAEVKQGRFDNLAVPESGKGQNLPAVADDRCQPLLASHRASIAEPPHELSAKPALLVNPFVMRGVRDDKVHLVEGFRFELIACLARFREWYVTGADDNLTHEQGIRVSSRYSVMTMVYQGDSTITVVMVLHEQSTNLDVWGERFELRLDCWFETQQHIVRRVAASLNVNLSTERLMRLSHLSDMSLEAHDIWLRAQLVINGYKAGDWNRTAQMLTKAIKREPGFSPLYSSLAQMNNVLHFVQPGLFRDEAHVWRTLDLAQQAVALDPRDSRAQLCLGWALAFCRRYSQAEVHMGIACALNSTDSHTLISSAAFYGYKGDTERALKQAMASMDLTLVPTMTHWQYLANIRYLHGDYEGTIIAAERGQGGLLTMPALRAAALCKMNRADEAMPNVARFYADVRAAWAGGAEPTDQLIAQWLLRLWPISRAEVWERLRDGIALTGMPTRHLTYHG
jgi:DNA-binding SARP family transcriptional activator/TolB-like protein